MWGVEVEQKWKLEQQTFRVALERTCGPRANLELVRANVRT